MEQLEREQVTGSVSVVIFQNRETAILSFVCGQRRRRSRQWGSSRR